MKKIILIPSLLTVGLMPMVGMVGCGQTINPTSIMLNETNLALAEGETFELKATFEPKGAVCNLEWTSSDDTVATVDDNGVVTALSGGDAIITVKGVGVENVKAECTVKVNEYFTVTALEESTFRTRYDFLAIDVNLQYCLNDEGWNNFEIVYPFSNPLTISQGSTLKLRGNNLSVSLGLFGLRLLFTGKVVFSGNIMSLIDESMSTTNIPCGRCFDSLFYVGKDSTFDDYHQSIVSAEELDLPDTDLTGAINCYQHLFDGCKSLKKGPRLKATILSEECYESMFSGCSSLEEIKLDYTGNFTTYCFPEWVKDVPTTGGKFYYNGTDMTFGVSAIPGTSASNHWEVLPLEER